MPARYNFSKLRSPKSILRFYSTMTSFTLETVQTVKHFSDQLFSFRTTRSRSLRFENGQFVMLSLRLGERRISRAYSIASANHEDHLEFYSIKAPHGEFTGHLKKLCVGGTILVSAKPTGSLVIRDLGPGRRLFLMATGTGVAPFMSIVKDPLTYERFEQVFLVRSASWSSGLDYASEILAQLRCDELLGEMVSRQLRDYAVSTRDSAGTHERITDSLESGRLFSSLGIAQLDTRCDRFMICGNMAMLRDTRRILEGKGLIGSPAIGESGDYVIERAFVDAASQAGRQVSAA